MQERPLRHARSYWLIAGAALALAPNAANAQTAPTTSYNIAAQDLGTALTRLAQQTNREIYFSADLTRGKRAPALRGSLTLEQALARLLAGSGLTYRINGGGSIIIEARVAAQTSPADDGTGIAVAEASAPEGELIVVTGTNIRDVGVAAPTIVLDREDFEEGGFTTLDEVFATVPQNFNAISPNGSITQEGASSAGISNRNSDKAAGVDLRGLGVESTLTLLNGNRRAGAAFGMVSDISVIPLAAVERVEIVTGGRSAVYGSDAIAGVVNVVTRHGFEGAETTLSYGTAGHGAERAQASQVIGFQSDDAGIIAAIDVLDETAFDLVREGLTRTTTTGATPVRREALPDTQRIAAFLAGHLDVSANLRLNMDTLYTYQRHESFDASQFPGIGRQLSTINDRNVNRQFAIGGSAELSLGEEWLVATRGGYSDSVSDGHFRSFQHRGAIPTLNIRDRSQKFSLKTVSLVASGPLPSIAGITPKVAFGGEGRWESFESIDSGNIPTTNSRDVKSLFGEIVLPLFDYAAGEPLLEISAAWRYDKYSDFGSAFTPQAGVIFRPLPGLKLSGAYSEAFRAPSLSELGSSNFIFIILVPDPQSGGALRPVYRLSGSDPDLEPETATTWSLTASYQPPASRRTLLEVSYYEVDYRNRIGFPILGVPDDQLLAREEFNNIIDRSPTDALLAGFAANAPFGVFNLTGLPYDPAIQTFLQAFPDIVLIDSRTTNSAVEKVRGIDFRARTGFDTGIGEIALGVSGTYTLNHTRKATLASPAFPEFNQVGRPVDLRLRGDLGWSNGPFAANLFVNYTDSYSNPFATPPGRISSWTTVDLTLRVDGSVFGSGSALSDSSFSITARNLFDERPPLFPDGGGAGILYDPANANPFGRVMTARLTLRY